MPKATTHPSAFEFIPERPTIPKLWEAAQGCRACDLYKNATQAVLGVGPRQAAAFFVGEQPGDQEDLAGKPFVGPAGKVLDEALAEAGIPREEVYVTNAVKHFKWEPRGKRRIHAKPTIGEVRACHPWLETGKFRAKGKNKGEVKKRGKKVKEAKEDRIIESGENELNWEEIRVKKKRDIKKVEKDKK